MSRRKLTDEQKKAASERLSKAREARGHDGSTNIHESIRDLPEDHHLHWKKVRQWIKHNKELRAAENKNLRKNVKGSLARVKIIEGYIRNMDTYLRTGDWVDNFYGQDQEKKISWKCVAPAYYDDGIMKRTVGVWYDDVGRWTKEMEKIMATVDLILGGADSSEEESNFMSKKKFTKMVEDAVRKKSMTYMDAVVYLCNDNQLEIEDVKKYIATSVKEKIEMEAMKLNYLERGESLPDTK